MAPQNADATVEPVGVELRGIGGKQPGGVPARVPDFFGAMWEQWIACLTYRTSALSRNDPGMLCAPQRRRSPVEEDSTHVDVG